MLREITLATALTLAPSFAFAQSQPSNGATGGAVSGATSGAIGGAIVGGPIGAAVGGVGGAVVGAIIGDAATPKFRTYVTEQNVSSYAYAEPIAVGTVLPSSGVVYHKLPAEYGSGNYEYTVVNKRTVVVEPGTRRVVQVIN